MKPLTLLTLIGALSGCSGYTADECATSVRCISPFWSWVVAIVGVLLLFYALLTWKRKP